ncbi:HAD family hydrolase [Allokutzneria sp. NRRL B-24872]|uniref:HAD family hydrolase n=1 Tax=Allokutzneria sp. NRRL B-24872 TaxID=1137961 RepID=UPI000A3BAD4B|nr:HAD-IA family hydrolase [Allokutzneria sp. NRRL B-24872]
MRGEGLSGRPSLLLLDLDGVLRDFGPAASVEDDHDLPRDSLAAAAFAADVLGPAIEGRIDAERWWAAARDRLVADHSTVDSERAGAAMRAFMRPGEVVPEALELVRRVRAGGCRVALLTNATSRLDADLRLLGLDREVDAVVSSARIGRAKPDPEAFRRALRVLQHSPSATLFCDDTAENVEAAAALGIDAAHVPTTAALREALSSRDLLDTGSHEGESTVDEESPLLVVLHEKDEAEDVADQLLREGWAPCTVHKQLLAGEDDAEDADWVVLVETTPEGLPAVCSKDALEDLADLRDGFVTDAG